MSVSNRRPRVRASRESRLANLVGAVATGMTDGIREAMCAAAELDPTSASALIALLDFTPRGSVQSLSQVIGLTHSGTVRLVDRLGGAGYVTRAPGGDARSRSIRLTTRGAALARSIRRGRERAILAPLETLSDSERAILSALCERLVGALTRERLEQRAAGGAPGGGALCRTCDFAACGRERGSCPRQPNSRAVLSAEHRPGANFGGRSPQPRTAGLPMIGLMDATSASHQHARRGSPTPQVRENALGAVTVPS
jgi:MarR family transcriptional regulator, negative regulator of the multidrug operon emrRAB